MANYVLSVIKFKDKKDFKNLYKGYYDWCDKPHEGWGMLYEYFDSKLKVFTDYRWDEYDFREKESILVVSLAWESPERMVKALSKRFPNGEIILTYADEDRGNHLGIIVYKDGKEIRRETDKEKKLSKAKIRNILADTWGLYG